MFVAVTGELFACGRGTNGQLGLGPPSHETPLEAVDTLQVR